MNRIVNRLRRATSEQGFSLTEVLVGGIILVVGLVMVAQFFTSAAARVLDSDIRSVLHQVATEELESIRGLPYTDVGTTDGHPQGTLAPDEDRVVQNITIHIHRKVTFWTDSSYSGPYPANYRRVNVTVTAVNRTGVKPVEVVSNVAGGADGGTLDITVTNIAGEPVEGAQITIENTHLVPNVLINSSDLKTDSLGRMIVPGLDPDSTTSYIVTASKQGYNTDYTDPGVVVVDGLPYTVVQLIIDELSTMVIKVVDFEGNEVEGRTLNITGPQDEPEVYEETVTSAAGGVVLTDMRYSTDLYPYLVTLPSGTLPSGQSYPTQTVMVVLEPGSTQEVVVTLPPPPTTTTTTASTTTTTVVGPTTTTSSTTTTSTSSTTTTTVRSTLTVTVRSASGSHARLKNARVALSDGQSLVTNKDGWVFFDNLVAGDYGITVTKNNYWSYNDTVTVNGATSITVYLYPR